MEHALRINLIALLFAAAILIPITGQAAMADSWMDPRTETTLSPNGNFRVTVEPTPEHLVDAYYQREQTGQSVERPNATAKLERKGSGDRWETVWDASLANLIAPVHVIVANDGRYVVTFDNWYSSGHGENVLVIYGADGSIVRSLQLTDLVPQMYKDSLSHSVSSIGWRKDAEIQPDGEMLSIDIYVPDGNLLLSGSKTVRFFVSLVDGSVTLPDPEEWDAALSLASDRTLKRIDSHLEWLDMMRNPISPPEGCEAWRWRNYLNEAYQRLRPAGLEPKYPFEYVLLPPGSEGHERFLSNFTWWFRDPRFKDNHMAVAAPCADDVLTAAIEDIAERAEEGWHANVTLYVAVDRTRYEHFADLLGPSGAKLIWLDPDVALPQRRDRIPGSDAQIAARNAEQQRLRALVAAEKAAEAAAN